MGLMATQAQAEHGTNTDFFIDSNQGGKWPNNVNRSYCISEDFWNRLPLGTANNAETSLSEGVERWENATQISVNFSTAGGPPGCHNYDFASRWANNGSTRAGFCDDIPLDAPNGVVQLDDLSSVPAFANSIAVSTTCDRDENGLIDYFVIAVNTDFTVGNGKTQWLWTTDPAAGEIDFLGVIVHEMGHGLGIDGGVPQPLVEGHFAEGGGACPDDSGRATMCPGSNGIKNSGGRPGTWARTLGPHDIGIVNDKY